MQIESVLANSRSNPTQQPPTKSVSIGQCRCHRANCSARLIEGITMDRPRTRPFVATLGYCALYATQCRFFYISNLRR